MRAGFNLPRVDERDVYRLAGELTVHPALVRVLIARGITDGPTARAFLRPTAADLGDPTEIPGVAEAAGRLLSAMEAGLLIFVAGDFDVDGLTGTAILVRTIRALGGDVEYYIPNRLLEGYDLSEGTVRLAAEKGARFLVTVDCGTRAEGPVATARDLGLEVVVTDHHRPGDMRPDALVVNPQYLPDGHPAKNLSGAGIAYKLAARMLELRTAVSLEVEDLLPLAALGTVCDVVPLTGENRTLARLGIERFAKTPFIGLQALIDSARVVGSKVTSWHLAFILGPRLNAAGRLGRTDIAAELLITDDRTLARSAASRLEGLNIERRELEGKILGDITASVGPEPPGDRMAIVVSADDWHPGVIGIVASRVVELYNRPAVLVSFSGDVGRGSCRSVPAFDIHNALEETEGFLVRFGGHRQAAGFEIRKEYYPGFEERFLEYARKNLSPADLVPDERVDAWMSLAEADTSAYEDLALLEPTGTGNEPPVMLSLAEVRPESRRIYKDEHLGFTAGLGPVRVRAIGFRMARENGLADEAGYYMLSYTPGLNSWQGMEKLELRIARIKRTEPTDHGFSIVDRRGALPGETVAANRSPATAVLAYNLSPAELPSEVKLINEVNGPASGDTFDRLILYAPPLSFSLMVVLLSFLKPGATVVFAYGKGQVEEARRVLSAMYPDKILLGEVYRALRRGGDLTDLKGIFHPRGVDNAVEIFRELGLVGSEGERVAILDDRGTRSLSASPTYNRCAGSRAAGLDFVRAISVWPAGKLDVLIASAIGLDFAGVVL